MAWLTGLFGLIGTGISSFFGAKEKQIDAIDSGLKTLADVNRSAGDREAAIAQIISAESTSGYWLSAVWRPMAMIIFLGIIVSFWFGYVPPQLEGPMPPMIEELFSLIKLGIAGYIPARTLEKVVDKIQIGKILQRYLK